MPLETAPQTLDDLNPLYPEATDVYTQGDDHIRSIKNVLAIQFPGISGQGFEIPITATEEEINFLSGVTSNLVDQYTAIELALADVQDSMPAPYGTVCLFNQAAAPTGWEQITSYDDYMVRIVNTAGGATGGTDSPFSFDWDHTHTTSSFKLSVLHYPPHTHVIHTCSDSNVVTVNDPTKRISVGDGFDPIDSTYAMAATGSSDPHTHGDTLGTISDFTPLYLNTILARCTIGSPPVLSWSQHSKLVASDPAENDQFGWSVAISGDGLTAVVGANLDDSPAVNAGSAYIYINSGGTWSEQAKLVASDQAAVDWFGYSVAISDDGNTVIVGSRYSNNPAAETGSAYVFTRSGTTWAQQAELVASDAAGNDQFGFSVAISDDGNTAIVGAIYGDSPTVQCGTAYIFTRSGITWSQIAELYPTVAVGSDFFGWSVDISGDGLTAIIGSTLHDSINADSGAAYIFIDTGGTWSQQAKLVPTISTAYGSFGNSVAISEDGNTAIVGAFEYDSPLDLAGSAYVFTRSGTTWTQQAELVASDQEAYDRFGTSVSISGDGNTAVVTCPLDDVHANATGSAYIFTRSGITWSEQAKLVASDQAIDRFGSSVAISSDGSTAIVGACFDDSPLANIGSAYIFNGT